MEFTIGIIVKYDLNIELIKKGKWIFDVDAQEWQKKEILIPSIDNDEILFIPDK